MKGRTAKTVARDASKLRVGIVLTDYNKDITESLLDGALQELQVWKVQEKNIRIERVYGAFEIPLGCELLIHSKKSPDLLIVLGCIIKGETKHDEYIAHAVASGLMRLQLDHGISIGFGILTPNTLAQAKERSQGENNKGIEAARAALSMTVRG